ncbi:hypothetical protein Cni_G01592 [Canna indica]|uniref:B box-type domain-containing protein n=1 Tax=Canna indica TaxID=4628 RepID=A0AAQ3JQX7_9LILI|nr:hypothetical protein Cni_G01592 [Canna indica]
MKISCDVCGEGEASVFCCADEAALCDACDRRVHWANKLAGKHRRLSLDPPSAQSHPLCDICKEKRAFLFCQEDRAILCRDCDAPIHGANHLTMKHNRFLLTGVRLSAAPISAPESEEGENSPGSIIAKTRQSKALKKDNAAAAINPITSSAAAVASAGGSGDPVKATLSTTATTTSSGTSGGGNSISEYLTKMCPGWHVEDLLVDDATAAAMDGFSKVEELLPFVEADLDGGGGLESICAPHVPQYIPPDPPGGGGGGHHQQWLGGKEVGIEFQQGAKHGRERWRDDAFMVPQISPVPAPNKRPRSHSIWYY